MHRLEKQLSFEERANAVRHAVYNAMYDHDPDMLDRCWVVGVYDTFAIIEELGAYWQALYTIDANDGVMVTPVAEWVKVEITWTAVLSDEERAIQAKRYKGRKGGSRHNKTDKQHIAAIYAAVTALGAPFDQADDEDEDMPMKSGVSVLVGGHRPELFTSSSGSSVGPAILPPRAPQPDAPSDALIAKRLMPILHTPAPMAKEGTVQKTLAFEVVERRADGGKIRITTASHDRDSDRVITAGGYLDNYSKNPVVQYGHNYYDPWATIGQTLSLAVGEGWMDADFVLREPVTPEDPMHIIRALWANGMLKTASIGFRPLKAVQNALGGFDYTEWELLEWSLVAIPANPEALALSIQRGVTALAPSLPPAADEAVPGPDMTDEQLSALEAQLLAVTRLLADRFVRAETAL